MADNTPPIPAPTYPHSGSGVKLPSQYNDTDNRPYVTGSVTTNNHFSDPSPSGKSDNGSKSDGAGAGAALGAGGLVIPGFERISELLGWLTDPNFWRRVGIGALGFTVLVLSIILVISSTKAGKAVVKGAGKVAEVAALA